MCDLTGVSPEQVVGKSYADVLEEWIPHLSSDYKEAAVEWLKKREHETSAYDGTEMCREDDLFPLPLPLRYDPSFKYASEKNMHHSEYVELLVAGVDRLPALYPGFLHSDKGVPQYGNHGDRVGWFFDTQGWVGGVEFTLRRKQFVPSLQTLCRELLPGDVVDEHGTLDIIAAAANAASDSKVAAAAPTPLTSREEENADHYEPIAKFIRSCDRVGMKYIHDVLSIVRQGNGANNRIKTFPFLEDWSANPATSEIHKTVLSALGGSEVIAQSVEGRMTWGFGSKNSKMDKAEKKEASRRRNAFNNLGRKLLTFIAPIVVENAEHARSLCKASDSSMTLNDPQRTWLTLKIEGIERFDEYSYEEEKFKDWAVVEVPAKLNFFQLHRVVCQTMNCSPDATRETHEWKAPILVGDWREQTAITDETCKHVQLGKTCRREEHGYFDDVLFDRGAALRQRISRTGAYFDHSVPLFSEEVNPYDRRIRGGRVDKIVACIHSTCISSVFYQPGAIAMLQNGLLSCCDKYKLTCLKCDEFTGPLPTNPNINLMQPKCLRGKTEYVDDDWSVAKANAQLERDRGCLRRIMCGRGPNAMTQMPWCGWNGWPVNKDTRNDDIRAPFPFAVQLRGVDKRPMILSGEPPLPGSDYYESYVSTLDGRIDPELRQEKIMARGRIFCRPFRYGRHNSYRGRWGTWGLDSYDSDGEHDSDCIGKVWTSEVDTEMARIDSLRPKTKPKAKRKQSKKRAKELGTKCGKRQSPDAGGDEDGRPAALDRDAVQGTKMRKTRTSNRDQDP